VGFIPGMPGWFNIQKSRSIMYYTNSMKSKNDMIISIDSEMTFDIMLNKLGIEGLYFNIIKAIYNKSIVNIILSVEKLKLSSLRSGTSKGSNIYHFYSTWCCKFQVEQSARETSEGHSNYYCLQMT
jgi:hypothetical protein